jgi:hypothetical protein
VGAKCHRGETTYAPLVLVSSGWARQPSAFSVAGVSRAGCFGKVEVVPPVAEAPSGGVVCVCRLLGTIEGLEPHALAAGREVSRTGASGRHKTLLT